MRNLKVLLVLLVAALGTGCLRISHTVNLKPDGSGTITRTLAVATAHAQQVSTMMGGSFVPPEAKLRQEAASMGPGVRFVSSTPYKAAGYEGLTATYAFDDVSKLTMNVEQAMRGGVNMPGTDGKPDPAADVKASFTRGATSVLTMQMPKLPVPDAAQRQQAEQAAQQAATNPQVEAMMKQLLSGLRVEVALNLQGQLVKTNAPYVEGTKIVLLRLDGDELIKSGKGAQQIMQLSKGADLRTLLTKIPGVKATLVPEVRIEFR